MKFNDNTIIQTNSFGKQICCVHAFISHMEPRGAAVEARVIGRGKIYLFLISHTPENNKMAAEKEVQQLLMVANFVHENAEVMSAQFKSIIELTRFTAGTEGRYHTVQYTN